jgi:hypothetical protein
MWSPLASSSSGRVGLATSSTGSGTGASAGAMRSPAGSNGVLLAASSRPAGVARMVSAAGLRLRQPPSPSPVPRSASGLVCRSPVMVTRNSPSTAPLGVTVSPTRRQPAAQLTSAV